MTAFLIMFTASMLCYLLGLSIGKATRRDPMRGVVLPDDPSSPIQGAAARARMEHECLTDEYLLTIHDEGFLDHPHDCNECLRLRLNAGRITDEQYASMLRLNSMRHSSYRP